MTTELCYLSLKSVLLEYLGSQKTKIFSSLALTAKRSCIHIAIVLDGSWKKKYLWMLANL